MSLTSKGLFFSYFEESGAKPMLEPSRNEGWGGGLGLFLSFCSAVLMCSLPSSCMSPGGSKMSAVMLELTCVV